MNSNKTSRGFSLGDVPYHAVVEEDYYVLGATQLRTALKSGETFGVFGDYDADGVTSTAIFTDVAEFFGASVVKPMINNIKYGFGINANAIHYLIKEGATHIVLLDSGTGVAAGDFEVLHEYANKPVHFYIIDHHVPASLEEFQDIKNITIINPHLSELGSNFATSLRTSTLMLLLARTLLRGELVSEQFASRLVSMAALGGRSDVMQKKEGNLHAFLLDKVRDKEFLAKYLPSFRLLTNELERDELTEENWIYLSITYGLGKYNMEASSLTSYYFVKTKSEKTARKYAAKIQKETEETLDTVQSATTTALENLMNVGSVEVALLSQNELPTKFLGLTGGISANLSKARSQFPTYLLVDTGEGFYKGSWRCYNNAGNWDGVKLLNSLRKELPRDLSGGGHPSAGGFRLDKEALPSFLKLLSKMS